MKSEAMPVDQEATAAQARGKGSSRRARAVAVAAAGVLVLVAVSFVIAKPGDTLVTTATVEAFQDAGDVGGGVLEPGTMYAPTTDDRATLERGEDWIEATIETSGLPAGAYTVWWVVFDTPDGCSETCDEDDLLNPDASVSVFWATGGVVDTDGTATFSARYRVGDDLGEQDAQQILGDGSLDPSRAEVHNIIKYHGPASSDPATLRSQTTTLLGECEEGANAIDLGEPFGVQCFDPQHVVYPAP